MTIEASGTTPILPSPEGKSKEIPLPHHIFNFSSGSRRFAAGDR
jgi:hypothetical protein